MKLLEVLLDMFTNTKLFEMAFAKKDAERKISDRDYVVAEHLTKLLAMKTAIAANTWKKDINKHLRYINGIKVAGNKKLSSDRIYDLLVSYPELYPTTYKNMLADEYSKIKWDLYVGIDDDYKTIMKKICDDLSVGNFTKIDDYL